MKAITLWQPYASLIVIGAKPWEWRGKHTASRATRLAGERVAIHAGARRPTAPEIQDILARVASGEASLVTEKTLLALCPGGDPANGIRSLDSWPLSSIVGTAIMGAPIPIEAWVKEHEKTGYDSVRFAHHLFALPMTEIQRFDVPIPARGERGFWEWNEAPP